MKFLFFMFLIVLLITFLFIFISIFISKKSFKELDKSSPIECGMNMINSPRVPFSIQFFLIAIMFMIFDVEIALIVPFPLIEILKINLFYSSVIIFLILLLLGVLYEWFNGALDWMI